MYRDNPAFAVDSRSQPLPLLGRRTLREGDPLGLQADKREVGLASPFADDGRNLNFDSGRPERGCEELGLRTCDNCLLGRRHLEQRHKRDSLARGREPVARCNRPPVERDHLAVVFVAEELLHMAARLLNPVGLSLCEARVARSQVHERASPGIPPRRKECCGPRQRAVRGVGALHVLLQVPPCVVKAGSGGKPKDQIRESRQDSEVQPRELQRPHSASHGTHAHGDKEDGKGKKHGKASPAGDPGEERLARKVMHWKRHCHRNGVSTFLRLGTVGKYGKRFVGAPRHDAQAALHGGQGTTAKRLARRIVVEQAQHLALERIRVRHL